ncbi:MAG: HEAT repeat domain-containing protein [Candidatus Bipolaricaulia bacterium]
MSAHADRDQAIDELIEALRDEDKRMREQAARALIEIGSDATPDLIKTLRDENWRVRHNATWVLGEIRDSRAVPALTKMLEDKEPSVRRAADKALKKIPADKVLSTSSQWEPSSPEPSTPDLGRMDVLTLMLLTFVTLGFYIPVWFLTKKRVINSLSSTEKLGSGAPIFALVLYGIAPIVSIAFATTDPSALNALGSLLSLVGEIITIVLTFKVRRIFNAHFNTFLERNIRFSRLWTLSFTILYLQYKINRF